MSRLTWPARLTMFYTLANSAVLLSSTMASDDLPSAQVMSSLSGTYPVHV